MTFYTYSCAWFPLYVIALIIADLPYGYNIETWDEALTAAELDRLMAAIKTVCSGSSSSTSSRSGPSPSRPMNGKCLIIWHAFDQNTMIAEALARAGWEKRVVCIWHKTGQNANGNLEDFVNGWECCTMSWFGVKDKTRIHLPHNPLDRQNIWMMPSVNAHSKIPGTQKDINFCEKPPQFAKQFCEWFGRPNDNILVLGFGSGSDLIGCLEANMNVVGVELDPVQFAAVIARLTTYIERKNAGNDETDRVLCEVQRSIERDGIDLCFKRGVP